MAAWAVPPAAEVGSATVSRCPCGHAQGVLQFTVGLFPFIYARLKSCWCRELLVFGRCFSSDGDFQTIMLAGLKVGYLQCPKYPSKARNEVPGSSAQARSLFFGR